MTAFSSVPSLRWNLPTMSICQSSIDLERSQRSGVLPALAPALLRLDEAVADEGPVDRRAPRGGGSTPSLGLEPVQDRPRTPGRVFTAHRDEAGLHLRRHLVRVAPRSRGLVDKRGREPFVGVPPEPGVHALASHPVAAGDIGDGRPVENVEDRPLPLFHDTELHEHKVLLRILRQIAPTAKKVATANWWMLGLPRCKAGTGASVAQVPEPRPESVKEVPEPQCEG